MNTVYNKIIYKKNPHLFDKVRGFELINDYLVYKSNNSKADLKVASILDFINKRVNYIIRNYQAVKFEPKIAKLLLLHPWLNDGMQLFKDIHVYHKKSFAELPPNTNFLGVNYPFGVHETNEVSIATDKKLRAEHRIIYLQIRQNNKFMTKKFMDNLICHELAHTITNDVIYRSEHSDYFAAADKLMNELWKIS